MLDDINWTLVWNVGVTFLLLATMFRCHVIERSLIQFQSQAAQMSRLVMIMSMAFAQKCGGNIVIQADEDGIKDFDNFKNRLDNNMKEMINMPNDVLNTIWQLTIINQLLMGAGVLFVIAIVLMDLKIVRLQRRVEQFESMFPPPDHR